MMDLQMKQYIENLETSIRRFEKFQDLMNSTKNAKEIEKYNTMVFDEMIETKDYIKEFGIHRLAKDSNERLEKVYLSGLTKPHFFKKEIIFLINELKNKLS